MTAASPSETLRTFFAPGPPLRLGVAVSGGSDSLALLHLLDDWRRAGGPDLSVATVDHGLRPEAGREAEFVAAIAAGLGLKHRVLRWQGWDGHGNLAAAARRARYALLADWARAEGLGLVALGHTADDQAETFLMRLARGSGVDGLSGMAARRRHLEVEWVRPLLTVRRADLQAELTRRGIGWVEDPSNADPAYERVRTRAALGALAPLGIGVEQLAATADRLRLARTALAGAAVALMRAAVRLEAGDVLIGRAPFEAAAEETRARLLSAALMWVASADYRPRFAALAAAQAAALAGRRASLHGCLILPSKRQIRVVREPAAVVGVEAGTDALWDGRWRLAGPGGRGLRIRALGAAGLAFCPDWRAGGAPRPSVLASPAIWQGERLVAAPLAGRANGWRAQTVRGEAAFRAALGQDD